MTDRWAWPTMGSFASLVVPGAEPGLGRAAMLSVRRWFDEVEAVLSPYRPDSDLCRWRSGEAPLADCSALLAEVIAAIENLPAATGGGFHPYDRAGRFDPTGYVKGWAVERGVELLRDAGLPDACLGVGGDIQSIGRTRDGRPWRVGVVDPADERRLVAVVAAPDAGGWAVATSGDAQRGEHIWSAPARAERPGNGGAPTAVELAGLPAVSVPAKTGTALRSVTVVGPRLSLADSYATAVWALARHAPVGQSWAWLAGTGYEALVVDRAGTARMTAGMPAHLIRPAA